MRTVVVTPHQFRVLCSLLKDGESNRVIARRLELSVETVKTHMKALLAATGCQDRTQLVVAILRGRLRVTDHEEETAA